jgi:hypothetical protein
LEQGGCIPLTLALEKLRQQRDRDSGMQDGTRPKQKAVDSGDAHPDEQDSHPRLKTKSPGREVRCDSAAFEGTQAMPRAKRLTPTQRASGMPMPSGFPSNSNTHGASGAAMKMTPTTISSHADAMTIYRCTIIFLRSLELTLAPECRRFRVGELHFFGTSLATPRS